MCKIYDVVYESADGTRHNYQIGAPNVIGAINSTLELRKDAKRVLGAKPADEL